MTGSSFVRLGVRLLVLAVLVVSGTYLLVYLYRWEWNRALISGLFLLAAEVAYVGLSVRAEVGRLAARIDALEAGGSTAQPRRGPVPGTPGARPARPFAWLRDSAAHTSVFVPVLLGTGVILSAAAFVVERLVGLVTTATAEHTAARRIAGLTPPANGLLEPVREPPPSPGRRLRRARVAGLAVRVGALVLVALSLAGAIGLLADATQSRPSPAVPGTSTVVELRVDQQRDRPAIQAAEALVVACRGTLRAGSAVTDIATIRADHVQIEVTPALSELRRRRLFGCLQDATLDLVQAEVVDWTTTPSATRAESPA